MDDRLHWSFGDGPNLRGKVFPEGFSADDSSLPRDIFDPMENWENAYDVIYTGPPHFEEDNKVYYGSLRLSQKHIDCRVKLRVHGIRQLQQHYRWERQHLEAEMVCNGDALYSLAKDTPWRIRLRLKNQYDPETQPFAPLDETGRLRDGGIEKQAADGSWYTYQSIGLGMPVVSDWALLAAVQQMPPFPEFRFAQLQQLERYFGDQRIRYLELFEARFGEQEVPLHGYVHTGKGMIPSYYWVDEHGRLLIARYALTTLVYNAHPRLEEVAKDDE